MPLLRCCAAESVRDRTIICIEPVSLASTCHRDLAAVAAAIETSEPPEGPPVEQFVASGLGIYPINSMRARRDHECKHPISSNIRPDPPKACAGRAVLRDTAPMSFRFEQISRVTERGSSTPNRPFLG